MTTRTATFEIECAQLRSSLVDYFEDDTSEAAAELRLAIDHHLVKCRECRAVYDGVRNVIRIMGDDRVFVLPAGFSERLHARLVCEIEPRGCSDDTRGPILLRKLRRLPLRPITCQPPTRE